MKKGFTEEQIIQIFLEQRPFVHRDIKTQFLIDFESSNGSEVITFGILEKTEQQLFCVLDARRITGAHPFIDFFESFIFVPG